MTDSPPPLPSPTPYTSPLEHLANCIERMRDLVTAYVLRKPEGDWRAGRTIDRDALIRRAKLWHVADVPEATRELWAAADRKAEWIRAREELTGARGLTLPLVRLARAFKLSPREIDVLLLAAVPRIDPVYAADWHPIDHDICHPEVGTAIAVLARTFEEGIRMRRLFALDAPLIASSVVLTERALGASEGSFLSTNIEVPRRIVTELLGEDAVDDELTVFSRLKRATIGLEQVVLPPETKDLVVSLVKHYPRFLERRREWGIDEIVTYGRGLVLLFSGPPGTGKTMLAHAIAHELGRRLFCIDWPKLVEAGRALESNLDGVFREAKLLDAVLFFDECEQIFASRKAGNEAIPTLLTRLEQFDGVAILATNMENVLDEALARRIVAKVDFREPTPSARAEIWRRHLPASLPLASDVDITRLSTDYELTGGYIKNAVLSAVVRAAARGAEDVEMADLEHGARLQIRVTADELASIVRPEASLDRVILPDAVREQVDRFVGAAKVRATVLGEWGFGRTLGRGTGLAALFAGPPGTGKSLTAEAIAGALERPLLRCSLSSVVSKYVGETARNVERVFRIADEHRAVLLFDEADALFAKRVQVHSAQDRFANAESAALLASMESFGGVVILTTNLVEELDTAFDRRLHARIDFPVPDAKARAAIWRTLLPKDAPVASDVDIVDLARRHELSGGGIRNAVLTAALEAASGAADGARLITREILERAAVEQRRASVVGVVPAGRRCDLS